VTALIAPGSDEWLRLVTASKVSAILGVSPYESPRSLWHKMRGDIPADPQTTVQARGHFLEAGILDWYFADHPELSRFGGEMTVLRDDLTWAAATPDDVATTVDGRESFPVDAKTIGRDDPNEGRDWGEPGTDQVPLHLVPQAMWVMHIGGWKRFVFTRLGPWLERDDYEVTYDPQLAADIEARCYEFVQSLGSATPPPLDDTIFTYDAVRAVAPIGDDDWECPPELAHELCRSRDDIKRAEARYNLARSRCIEQMGGFQRVVCAGQVLGQKQRTKAGAALYPPRKAVDIDALPLITATTDQETAA
jgi:hypothetical protein